jgi:hypothetical protein
VKESNQLRSLSIEDLENIKAGMINLGGI